MDCPLEPNHTFLITGASRGLGRALAKTYAEAGHTVFGCSRSDSGFAHQYYRHIVADVTDDAAVRYLYKEIGAAGGQVDVLVNNAGLALSRAALLTTSAEAEEVLRTNVLGGFIILRETIKHMKRARRGRIVNMSSINVALGSIGGALYNASKAALENLGYTLSREVASDNITINTIGLSIVTNTTMTSELNDKALKEKQVALIKPDRIDASEVAHLIDFFISEEARNITNQVVYFGGVR